MSTPIHRPLGLRPSLGNSAASGNIVDHKSTGNNNPHFTAPRHELARAASYNALTGAYASSRPSFTPSSPPQAAMDGEQENVLDIGDTVEVPGGMSGVVKYIGGVKGKSGTFAGVELSRQFAARGKNDGDVDGIRYFSTSVPGSGIFLPSHRAIKQASPTLTAESFPPTPTTPGFSKLDLNNKSNGPDSQTPPTPSLPKFSQSLGPGSRPNFSQSVGPGARAPSPQHKGAKGRPSLPRPESPVRKQPAAQPTPNGRTSTPGGFSSSLRGGRPNLPASPAPRKSGPPKPVTPAPGRTPSRNQSRQGVQSPEQEIPRPPSSRLSNGPVSMNHAKQASNSSNEETSRLERALEERDKQLKEQAASLAEMESSLAELQSMMATSSAMRSPPPTAEPGTEGADVMQLRSLLREKNEKISMLTAEFDTHRADFRSTIDALEMASTETERVYEKRVDELVRENQELQERGDDVESIAKQLKQLEELVAELEEGLEDARRGEAEARSEVEFLRGEVERSRTELRREREKAARALKGAGAAVDGNSTPTDPRSSREVEQRDDEIRGLKAIIHSLSSGPDVGTPQPENTKGLTRNHSIDTDELAKLRHAMETMQREKSELQGLVDRKSHREEELERELTSLRQNPQPPIINEVEPTDTDSNTFHQYNKSSISSTKTAIGPNSRPASGRTNSRGSFSAFPAPLTPSTSKTSPQPPQDSSASLAETASKSIDAPDAAQLSAETSSKLVDPTDAGSRSGPVATAPSEASVESTLWCEICETPGHDVLSCTNIGTDASKGRASIESARKSLRRRAEQGTTADTGNGTGNAPTPTAEDAHEQKEEFKDAGETPLQDDDAQLGEDGSGAPVLSAPLDASGEGPAPGKASKVVDMTKWCALCERDGHESVDCPFDDF